MGFFSIFYYLFVFLKFRERDMGFVSSLFVIFRIFYKFFVTIFYS